MKKPIPSLGIYSRYDLHLEVERQRARQVSDDEVLQNVADCLILGDDENIEQVVEIALQTREPMDVINHGLVKGMQEVSRLWAAGDYFLPQAILSSDAMVCGIALCEQRMGRSMQRRGKVITHTAEGDIHDIGQLIVNALLNAAGFEVVNLGADVPVDTVVEACMHHKPLMLTGTALMTTTMTAFPKIAAKLRELHLEIPFVCGGGAVNMEFVHGFDLGIYGKDASQAPGMVEDALEGLDWREIRAKWNR